MEIQWYLNEETFGNSNSFLSKNQLRLIKKYMSLSTSMDSGNPSFGQSILKKYGVDLLKSIQVSIIWYHIVWKY